MKEMLHIWPAKHSICFYPVVKKTLDDSVAFVKIVYYDVHMASTRACYKTK